LKQRWRRAAKKERPKLRPKNSRMNKIVKTKMLLQQRRRLMKRLLPLQRSRLMMRLPQRRRLMMRLLQR